MKYDDPHVQEIADGAYGDGPFTRGLARDLLARDRASASRPPISTPDAASLDAGAPIDGAGGPIGPRPTGTSDLIAALTEIELACDAMIAAGQGDALLALDNARANARMILAAHCGRADPPTSRSDPDCAAQNTAPRDIEETLRVVRTAYGWTVDIDGRVYGLVAGDMGYDPTGIVIPDGHWPHFLSGSDIRHTGINGDTEDYRVTPLQLKYGASESDPEPQWILIAWDWALEQKREFTLAGFLPVPEGIVHPDTAGTHTAVPIGQWETFKDPGQCDMWCVRKVRLEKSGESFHVASEEEAKNWPSC